MSSSFKLALTQKHISSGYKFKDTGINVYSFEEALYHFYYKWRDSQKDFLANEFINWVNKELELSDIANEIFKFRKIKDLSERYIAFLSVVDYFNESELTYLKNEIKKFESEINSIQLKEEGDNLFLEWKYEEAIKSYERAISYKPNYKLYNNIALAYSNLGNYKMAIHYNELSFRDVSNEPDTIFNYAENLILNNEIDKAKKISELLPEDEKKYYLIGKINLENNNYIHAVNSFKKAYDLSGDDTYLYEIIEIYEDLKIYDQGIKYLDIIKNKNDKYLLKLADFLGKTNSVEKSISYLLKASNIEPRNINIWLNLAKHYRNNKQFNEAEASLEKAFELDNKDKRVLLEKAMINKEMGKVKDYQLILSDILSNFKEEYRELKSI